MRDSLKKKIVHVLAKFPKTRDDDRILMAAFYQEFFPHGCKNGWMSPDAWAKITNPDDLVRIRAIIQNEDHLYLPRNAEVRKRRRQNEEVWRSWVNVQKNKTCLDEAVKSSLS